MFARRTADSAIAAILIIIGIAQMWGGFTMDRLEVRHIHPASIPGLLPIILGAAMVILAAIVFTVSRRPASQSPDGEETISRNEIASFAWVVALTCIYALFLVGTLHFWLASAVFVFTFILYAEWDTLKSGTTTKRLITLGTALAIAVIVTGGISFLFEDGFLVRLP